MAEDGGKREIVVIPEGTPSDAQGQVIHPPAVPHAVQGQVVRTLRLGPQQDLDLTNLDPRQAAALEAKAHEKAIERDDRRQQLKDDLGATAAQLSIFTKAVEDATAQNAAVTITNTKDDSQGRTEIILGNSAAAQSGKLSRSQQGFTDNAKLWTVLAVIAGIVIVVVALLRR